MPRNNIKFIFLVILLSVFQVTINNSTGLYIDCLSVAIIILLFSNVFSFIVVVLLSLLADLLGHWYLGSHLFVAVALSFLSVPLINYYRLSGYVQMSVIVCIFYALLTAVITLIGFVTHNLFINWLGFVVEIFILCPVIQGLFIMFGIKAVTQDIIY